MQLNVEKWVLNARENFLSPYQDNWLVFSNFLNDLSWTESPVCWLIAPGSHWQNEYVFQRNSTFFYCTKTIPMEIYCNQSNKWSFYFLAGELSGEEEIEN